MATYFFRNTGSNSFNTGTNWSLTSGGASAGVVPGVGDTATFDNNSFTSCDIDVAAKTIATINFNQPPNGFTLTVTNSITLSSSFTITSNSINTFTINGNTINVAASLTVGNGFGFTGSATINLNGTGTWSGTAVVATNLTINTAGTITISGSVNYSTGTLTYTTGTVTTTGSTFTSGFNVSTTVLNTNGITWNNFAAGGGSTITLSSAMQVVNASLGSGNTLVINGSNLLISGNYTNTHSLSTFTSGTSTFVLNGTGVWSNSSNGVLKNNLTFNTTGTITVSGTVLYDTGTLTYTAGTVTTTGSTLSIASSCILNTNGMSWNNVTLGAVTLTLSSNLTGIGTLTIPNVSATFAGAGGCTFANMVATSTSAVAKTIIMVSTNTYLFTSSISVSVVASGDITLRSSTGGSKTIFRLQSGGSQLISGPGKFNGLDVDSSGGNTIRTTPASTITNTINWGKKGGGFITLMD